MTIEHACKYGIKTKTLIVDEAGIVDFDTIIGLLPNVT